MQLDPNRPHSLADVIERFNARQGGDVSRLPSWADVCLVREYVGNEAWQAMRESGNDYELALNVLYHLVDVEGARSSIAPYLMANCGRHNVPAGHACIEEPDSAFACFFPSDPKALSLPPKPYVCAHRVLAAHDRSAAAELFAQEPRAEEASLDPTLASRTALPISGAVTPDGVAIVSVQHRHPSKFHLSRIFVSQGRDWTIQDIRVDGESIIAPHHALPGDLFGSHVQAELRLPTIEQDQWIEIEARRIRGEMPWFYASVMGTQQREERVR